MRFIALLLSTCLLLFTPGTSAHRNASTQYIALDVYYGILGSPCINSFSGWSPSLKALQNPEKCYGIEDDHDITCVSRRMNRINDDEKMISTAPMSCKVQGYTNNNCSGSTYWPAEYNAMNQSWTWVWDQSVGIVDIGSFSITCR